MPNPIVTEITTKGVVIIGAAFEDATLTAAAAETWPEGTVLAKADAEPAKYVRFDPAGADGVEVPKAVLSYAQTFTAAGDVGGRVLISGEVRKSMLVDAAGVALTPAAIDALRDYTIITKSTTQLAEFDNQ